MSHLLPATLVLASALGQGPKDRPPTPQQVAAAEKALTDFGCKLHRDAEAPGRPVDLVWFPPKTNDPVLARLVPKVAVLGTVGMLDLGETRVSDAGLTHLARLPRLHSVYLNRTAVTDVGVKTLAELPDLHWLDLSRSRVTSRAAADLAGCPRLQHLFLDGIRLSPEAVSTLARLARLQSLDVTAAELNTAAMKDIGRLTELKDLRLALPAGDGFRELGRLTALESLRMRGGRLPAPDLWDVLGGLDRLRALDLSAVDEDDWTYYRKWLTAKAEATEKPAALRPTLDGLGGLTQLRRLDLTGLPGVTDDLLPVIGRLTGLEELNVSCTSVTLADGKDLENLTSLRHLHVRNAHVAAAGLRSLEPLAELRVLWLYDNPIGGASVSRLQKALPRCGIYWRYTSGGTSHNWRVPAGGYGR